MIAPVILPELARDLVLMVKGDSFTVQIANGFDAEGWPGGQFVKYTTPVGGFPTVTKADGRYCGFMIFGSNEQADQFTSMTQQNVVYSYATLQFGGNVFYTRTYEEFGYLARNGLGPMVPLVYTPNQFLYISENGKITNENESDQALFPPHNFPDGTPVPDNSFIAFGLCFAPPQPATNFYIGCQSNIGV